MRRRKIDLLPAALHDWLREELTGRGHSDYREITGALNTRIAEAGLEISVGKSAVIEYGAEHREFAKLQQEASGWAAEWIGEVGLEDEARRHSALFEMITTLAFKATKARFSQDGEDIQPRDLHFLGRMLKDLMASSGLREALSENERLRLAAQERRAGAERATTAAHRAGLSPEVAAAIRAAVEGGPAAPEVTA